MPPGPVVATSEHAAEFLTAACFLAARHGKLRGYREDVGCDACLCPDGTGAVLGCASG